jgi:hypothetical protein
LFSLNRERILLLTELQNPNATHQQQPFNHHTTNRTMARTKRFARNIPGGNYPNGYPKLMPSTVSPHMYPPASGGIKKKEKRSQLPLLNGDEDQASSDDDPVGVPSMVTVSDDGEVEEQEPPSGDTQLGAAAAADTPLDDIYTASAFVQDVKALLARLDKAAVAGPSADIRASRSRRRRSRSRRRRSRRASSPKAMASPTSTRRNSWRREAARTRRTQKRSICTSTSTIPPPPLPVRQLDVDQVRQVRG